MKKLFALAGANPLLTAAIIFGLGVFLLGALGLYLRHQDRVAQRHENQQQEAGANRERLQQNEEVINAVRNSQRPASDNELERVRSEFDRNRRQNSQ